MKVVFLGPPGAGKGTQAKLVSERLQLAHISTGDMLRQAVSEGTALGKQVKEVMDRGQLVSDDLIVKLIEERIQRSDCVHGYILDGFPRTVKQAEALEAMFERAKGKLDAVVLFELTEQDLLSRLSHRRSAEARADDDAETQKERLRIYQEQTAPLIDYYRKKNMLLSVNATGSIEEILDRVLSILK